MKYLENRRIDLNGTIGQPVYSYRGISGVRRHHTWITM
jgi:hypothetical protein